jgi:hypothetical protein
MLRGTGVNATYDLLKKGLRMRTRWIMTDSWPSRAAERAICELGTLRKREKLLRSTCALNMAGAGAKGECYDGAEEKVGDMKASCEDGAGEQVY